MQEIPIGETVRKREVLRASGIQRSDTSEDRVRSQLDY